MLKKLLFLFALTSLATCFAQDAHSTGGDAAFAVIENIPIYPGCKEESNVDLKKCMSDKITKFISMNFNMKKIEALDLPPKVYGTTVQFKIDKEGKVVDVRARAENSEIEKEAARVVGDLPQMIPGKQRGEAVGVLYALPIIFEIVPPMKKVEKKIGRKG